MCDGTYSSCEWNASGTKASWVERWGIAATPFGEVGVAHAGVTNLRREESKRDKEETSIAFCLNKSEDFARSLFHVLGHFYIPLQANHEIHICCWYVVPFKPLLIPYRRKRKHSTNQLCISHFHDHKIKKKKKPLLVDIIEILFFSFP